MSQELEKTEMRDHSQRPTQQELDKCKDLAKSIYRLNFEGLGEEGRLEAQIEEWDKVFPDIERFEGNLGDELSNEVERWLKQISDGVDNFIQFI